MLENFQKEYILNNLSKGLLNDTEILKLCKEYSMISPYSDVGIREVNGVKVVSYGLGHFGYDITLSDTFKELVKCDILDVKNNNESYYRELNAKEYYILEPLHSVLAFSNEVFNMPDDILGVCLGKSTYARCNLLTNVTPLEPSWKGRLVMELTNLSNKTPIRLYVNEGIAQILFFKGNKPNVNYHSKGGKYQNQELLEIGKV